MNNLKYKFSVAIDSGSILIFEDLRRIYLKI